MAISVIQGPNGNVPDQGHATWSGNPFSGNVAQGHLILIALGSLTGSLPVVSITDNLNAGSYTLFPGSLTTGNSRSLAWYYMPNTNAGQLTVTVSLSPAQSTSLFWGFEVAGAGIAPTLDGAVTASFASTSSPTCGPLTTTNANDLLLVVFRGGTFSAGAWTSPPGVNPGQLQYIIESSTGAYTASATTTVNQVGASLIAIEASTAIPVLTADGATNVLATSVTLNGTITSAGDGSPSTSWGFNYGLTNTYGNTVTVGGSKITGSFAVPVVGLAPGITYHYQSFAINQNGTGNSADATFTTAAGTHPGAGEVLFMSPVPAIFNGTTNVGSPNNLADATNETGWGTSSFHAWAGLDLGVAAVLTRLRFTATPTSEDAAIGTTINANATDVLFLSGNVNLDTIPGPRPLTGTLLNERILPTPPAPPGYRYYNVQALINHGFPFYDTDFIGQWTSGLYSRPVAPTITPPYANVDQPVLVTINPSISTAAVIYYTTDGSTPTNASTLYTGPFVIKSDTLLQAIAYDQLLSTPASRVTKAYFLIPSKFYSKHFFVDDRGYKLMAFEGTMFHDPVSGWWYQYGAESDVPAGGTSFATLGVNIYRSADLRNWTYMGNIAGPAAGAQIGYVHQYRIRTWVLYNTNTQLYVMWFGNANTLTKALEVWTSPFPDARQPWTQTAVYNTGNLLADGVPVFDFYGDFGIFTDPVGGGSYIIYNYHTNSLTSFSPLDPATFTNTLSTGSAQYALGEEAHSMIYHGGTYFHIASGLYVQAYGDNFYRTASSPIGPFSGETRPFVTVSGNNPPAAAAYNSQNMQTFLLPGRGPDAFVWIGTDGGNLANGSTFHGSFSSQNIIPVTFPSSSTMSIQWILPGNFLETSPNGTTLLDSPWNIDATFPTVSGAPLAATGLVVAGPIATWINNEPFPAHIYLDSAPDAGFGTGVVSQILPFGATSATVQVPNAWYRIRTVNVSGTTNSSASPQTNPITVSTTGYYVTFSIYSTYAAFFLKAGTDYEWLFQRTVSGPFPDFYSAEAARIAIGNPPYS